MGWEVWNCALKTSFISTLAAKPERCKSSGKEAMCKVAETSGWCLLRIVSTVCCCVEPLVSAHAIRWQCSQYEPGPRVQHIAARGSGTEGRCKGIAGIHRWAPLWSRKTGIFQVRWNMCATHNCEVFFTCVAPRLDSCTHLQPSNLFSMGSVVKIRWRVGKWHTGTVNGNSPFHARTLQ